MVPPPGLTPTRPRRPAAAPAQLALAVDPLADDPGPAVVDAIEAKIEADDLQRSRFATPAPACRCWRPWRDDGRCVRCGRGVA
jgi:hypothetical protein